MAVRQVTVLKIHVQTAAGRSFRIDVLTWVQDHVRLWSYIQLIYTVFTLYICVHNVHIYKA